MRARVWTGMGVAIALAAVPALGAPGVPAPPQDWVYAASGAPLTAGHGVVASVSPAASRVGVGVLKAGGNAVDAAVAVAFALAVTWPEAGNIGGGGFMVGRTPKGETYALDYRETAPAQASASMFLDAQGNVVPGLSLSTRLGVGTPGTVAGLWEVHRKYGRRPWASLVAPAIALAESGVVVDAGLARSLEKYRGDLSRDPEASRIFLPGGRTPRLGDRLRQPELAGTLRLVAAQGPAGFYRGTVAEAIASDMKAHGGLVTQEDLAGYRPRWREPLRFTYRGLRFASMPPPSSGGLILAEVLGMLQRDDLRALGWHTPAMIHLVAEAERRAFADRNTYLGDPDSLSNPLKALMDPTYLARRRATIDPMHAQPAYSGKPGLDDKPETTHFIVADREGGVVTSTYTLNGAYGTCIVPKGTGVLLNNEMDDFTSKPGAPNLFGLVQGVRNAIAPGKRMLSSMSPTLVEDAQGRFVLATGSPGGSTIPTTTLQVLLNVLDYGMDARQAVEAPRFHHQGLPEAIDLEPGGFPEKTVEGLKAMGHVLNPRPLGDAQLVIRKGNGFEAWSDPRKGGLAVGY